MNGGALIADADYQRGKRVAAACEDLGIETCVVTHGAAALERALADPPAVLVVQLGLPLIDGAQLGGILHANPRTNGVGVLYLADTTADAARVLGISEPTAKRYWTFGRAWLFRELNRMETS